MMGLLWLSLTTYSFYHDGLPTQWWLLLGCASVIGIVGLLDDYLDISAKIRLAIQFVMATLAIYIVLSMSLPHAQTQYSIGPGLAMVSLFALVLFALFSFVWLVNLYNFMDGIDGYAASETIFVCLLTAILLATAPDISNETINSELFLLTTLSVIAGAFLIFNWPKATLFMGDSGSGFIGFFIGCMVLITINYDYISFYTWLVVLSLFTVDSTLALIRRVLAGKLFYAAHRSHAYQNMSRKYRSHVVVTLSGIGINLLIVAPLALCSHSYPEYSLYCVLLTYIILGAVMFWAGSGKSGLYET